MKPDENVLIIGGGIIGSSIAYFLKKIEPAVPVIVIERDPTYLKSCTRLSASAIRQQFNLAINVAMSRFTYDFFKNASTHLSVEDETINLQFTDCPYLVLAAPEGESRLADAHKRQLAAGARIEFMNAEQLASKVPWLKMEGISAGCLGLEGEGWFDPSLALKALQRKAEALGVVYLTAEVAGMNRKRDRITEVLTTDGRVIQGTSVVNAGGAQAAKISTMADVSIPIESRKRSAFIFSAVNPPPGFTNLIDPTFLNRGVYTRPYGGYFMSVTSPDPSEDPDTQNLDVDFTLFERVVQPALARRVRGFEKIELINAWAGLYEMNCFDQNAVLGPYPEIHNFFFACGLSGHGVMHSAAIGRGIAEQILTGRYQTLDLTPFHFQRILQKKPLDDVQASEHRKTPTGV